MADRDSIYRLENMIEFDDTLVGGRHVGKRGRGPERKRPVLVAVETPEKDADFIAMQAVNNCFQSNRSQFSTG